MKQSILFLSLTLSAMLASAQVTIDNDLVLGGSENDVAYGLLSTSDGNYLVSGYSRSTDFDVSANNGLYDYWIVKTSTAGAVIWETNLGGSGDDLARCAVEISGNYYVAGFTASADGDVSANNGGQDGWLVKLDGDGNLLWEKNYGGTGNDLILDMLAASDGGVLMMGYTASADGDLSASYGNNDIWVIKTDADGNIDWSRNYGGSENDFGNAVVEIPGGYIMTGATYSNDNDVSGNHADLSITSDSWVVRIDDSGDIVWQSCLGGVNNEIGEDLVITASNTIVVASSSKSDDGDVSGHYGELNKFDIWLCEVNNTGDVLQEQNFGGSRDDSPSALLIDDDGGFVVTGVSASDDFDLTGHYGAASAVDIWIMKTDDSFVLQWQKNIGGSQTDYCEAFLPTGDTTYVLAAYTKSNDLDVSTHYGASGNNDIWMVYLVPGEEDTTSCDVAVTEQPADILACPGADATFTVGGAGTVTSYVWIFTASGANFTTSEPSLTLEDVSTGFSSEFYVILVGDCGNDTSELATFSVGELPAPDIFPVLPPSICEEPVITLSTPEVAGYFYQWYFNGSLIPGATSFEYDATFAGEYYVVIDNGDGCSATSETVEITSSGPAALVTLDGPANICNSGSVTMTTITGAGYLYQWYKDGSPIAGATTNTYTTSELGAYFVNINVDGCTSTSVTINVINETPESVTNALGDLDICESGSVSLTCTTSGVGYSFQWLKDDEAIPGATTITIFALDTGSYTCVVSNTFGCSDTSEALLVYTSCPDTTVNPAVQDLSSLLGMQIYPNPAESVAQLSVEVSAALTGSYQLQVMQTTGRVVEEMVIELGQGTRQINLETRNWPAGIYLVRLTHD
ncbi:MAG TPA: immunoglobulin domain-containing protein, partial [Chitinophagales bacterium]|nr:immunoglobulin domain-containing protein [Chitinophagales bacterium]